MSSRSPGRRGVTGSARGPGVSRRVAAATLSRLCPDRRAAPRRAESPTPRGGGRRGLALGARGGPGAGRGRTGPETGRKAAGRQGAAPSVNVGGQGSGDSGGGDLRRPPS